MTDEDLIKEHSNEETEKLLKDNPPEIIRQLLYVPNEAIISELSAKDLIQLGSRYVNDICVYLKNILHLEIRLEKELSWLLESKGVDVKAKFKEDAKEQEKRLEEQERAIKEQLKNIKA